MRVGEPVPGRRPGLFLAGALVLVGVLLAAGAGWIMFEARAELVQVQQALIRAEAEAERQDRAIAGLTREIASLRSDTVASSAGVGVGDAGELRALVEDILSEGVGLLRVREVQVLNPGAEPVIHAKAAQDGSGWLSVTGADAARVVTRFYQGRPRLEMWRQDGTRSLDLFETSAGHGAASFHAGEHHRLYIGGADRENGLLIQLLYKDIALVELFDHVSTAGARGGALSFGGDDKQRDLWLGSSGTTNAGGVIVYDHAGDPACLVAPSRVGCE